MGSASMASTATLFKRFLLVGKRTLTRGTRSPAAQAPFWRSGRIGSRRRAGARTSYGESPPPLSRRSQRTLKTSQMPTSDGKLPTSGDYGAGRSSSPRGKARSPSTGGGGGASSSSALHRRGPSQRGHDTLCALSSKRGRDPRPHLCRLRCLSGHLGQGVAGSGPPSALGLRLSAGSVGASRRGRDAASSCLRPLHVEARPLTAVVLDTRRGTRDS